MEVWILHISHCHGDDYSVHPSAESAESALYAYCLDQWDEGLSEQYGAPNTLTREDCIEAYFAAWERALDPECYMLEPFLLKHIAIGRTTELIAALGMAIQAMNRVSDFDTGVLCSQTGRSLSSYQLLPQLEQLLQGNSGQDGYMENRQEVTSALLRMIDRPTLIQIACDIYEQAGYKPFPWHIDDIRHAWIQKHDSDCPLTDAQCRAILERMSKNHDATIGINWEVIGCYLDEVTS